MSKKIEPIVLGAWGAFVVASVFLNSPVVTTIALLMNTAIIGYFAYSAGVTKEKMRVATIMQSELKILADSGEGVDQLKTDEEKAEAIRKHHKAHADFLDNIVSRIIKQ